MQLTTRFTGTAGNHGYGRLAADNVVKADLICSIAKEKKSRKYENGIKRKQEGFLVLIAFRSPA